MYRTAAALLTRWNALVTDDRGDSPIPSVIIWVGIAGLAVALLGLAGAYIASWTRLWPNAALPGIG
jgi:hypothetical protein